MEPTKKQEQEAFAHTIYPTILKAKDYLEMLEPIPSKNWITDKYTDRSSCCCAVGHVTRLTSKNPEDYFFSNCEDSGQGAFRVLSEKYFKKLGLELEFAPSLFRPNVAFVNNAPTKLYPQKTPKARVIALLKDMDKAGF